MKDLTKGNPFKLILLFMLPVLGGNVFQQLYNMADTVIVGNTVNADALTGVGLTGPVSFLIIGFVGGLTAGFGVRVAQRYGAQDEDGVRRAIAMSFVLGLIITVVLTAIAVPLTAPLLRLMQTPEQYFDYAYSYLFVIFCGIGASVLYNMVAGVLRAVGDTKTPLFFLVLAACLNVALDFAFIVGAKMHYHGAALATVLSQILSGVACFIYMWKRYPALRLRKGDFAWDWKNAGGHVAVGLPMALQFSITAIGCIVQQTALNGLNVLCPGVVTAFAAASKIDNLAAQTFQSLGTASATYAGQNSGAKRYDRIRKGVLVSMVYVLAGWAIGFAFCIGLYTPLMKLFVNPEKGGDAAIYYGDIMRYGRQYLLFQSGSYLFLGAILVVRNALQGMGYSLVTMLSGVTELAARCLTAFVFVRLWGFTGACLSNPVAWISADVFLLITYFIVMRKRLARQKREEAEARAEAVPVKEDGAQPSEAKNACPHGAR